MATFKGATFEIISEGRSCPMYDDPDENDGQVPSAQAKYIEAVTGAAFEIKVTLEPDFDFAGANAVRVTATFDGAQNSWYIDIDQTAKLLRRYAVMDNPPTYCSETRRWVEGCFGFGKLDISKLDTLLTVCYKAAKG